MFSKNVSFPTVFSNFCLRAHGRCQRTLNHLFFRRTIATNNSTPYISFTFDDFPRSALYVGGDILMRFDLRATFYASFGLMSTDAPTGKIFLPGDIAYLLEHGHELGCHTFTHCNPYTTSPLAFEDSIIKNEHALDLLAYGASFRSFSYPIDGPRLATKQIAARHFSCCRGGGQTFNAGRVDLNLLKAFFLEQSLGNVELVKKVIDKNSQAGGWLIFATHDIDNNPSRFGVTPSFFENIVQYARDSGATILPVDEVLHIIKTSTLGD